MYSTASGKASDFEAAAAVRSGEWNADEADDTDEARIGTSACRCVVGAVRPPSASFRVIRLVRVPFPARVARPASAGSLSNGFQFETIPTPAKETTLQIRRNPTRPVRIGSITIGAEYKIAVQSMTATHTQDVDATVRQIVDLQQAGADVVRIAVDSRRDAQALAEIRQRTSANLSVDLQENYRLAEHVAPHVDKIRYNPGHLYHHETNRPWQDKVKYLVEIAGQADCALRVGINCGSVDPDQRGPVPRRRLDLADAGQCLAARRAAGLAGVHALLRIAEGLGPAQSH